MPIVIAPEHEVPPLTVVNSGGALVTGAVLYAGPCIVYQVHATHAGGGASYVQIHDSATVPADGAVPLFTHSVSANSDADIEPYPPLYFENGLYVCESSTVPTKTISVSADLFAAAVIGT